MMAAFLKPSAHFEPIEGQSEANFFFSPVIPAKAGIQHETSDGLDSHLHGNDESFKNTVRPEPVEGRMQTIPLSKYASQKEIAL